MTKTAVDNKRAQDVKTLFNVKSTRSVALRVRNRGYAPISNFRVGAAILDERGIIHAGCNVENTLQAAIHAEVAALSAMIAGGGIRIEYLAVTAVPCGACRAMLAEFMTEDTVIAVVSEDSEEVTEYSISELYPHAFALT